MPLVRGTEGYAAVTKRFVEATIAIAFQDLHQSFLGFIPTHPARVLDIGSGIGRDTAAFADMGHTVVAVEPTSEFLAVAQNLYGSEIEWINDSLPLLQSLMVNTVPFALEDFCNLPLFGVEECSSDLYLIDIS